MSLFRRTLDVSIAAPRAATAHDLPAIQQLLRETSHCFFTTPTSDLAALLSSAPAAVLQAENALWGAAIANWPVDNVCWLRGLVFASGLPVSSGMDALLPTFHDLLRARGLRQIFYAGDLSSDSWMQTGLLRRGYAHETDVVVYENRRFDLPATGKPDVTVRHAAPVDLPAVLAVDRASFSAQWVKDEGVLGPAIVEIPFFIVAEQHGTVMGYAFATTHFNGRLMHLVRIAVHPDYQAQGIGIRLLAQTVAYARTSGAESLTLNTQQENYRAQRLYEWFGFRRTGERQTVLRLDL